MGMFLRPRHKELGTFHCGGFFWSWLLNEGVGLVIGAGPGIEPASFIFHGDGRKKCGDPYNGGFRVTSKQAKEMSWSALAVLKIQQHKQRQFDALDEKMKQYIRDDNRKLFSPPVRSDWRIVLERFVEFSCNSGGFEIL